MPCMSQTSTNPLRAPHVPPISIRRPPRHHHSALKPVPHPRSHPAPPSPAEPNQGQPYVDVDAQDPGNPSSPPPPDPGHPPLTPATIRDPNLLRATLQGRAPTTPLGWYRLQEDWTKLSVKALRDLTTPGNGPRDHRRPRTLASPQTHPGPARLDPPHRVGPGPDTRHRHQRHASRDRTPTTGPSGEGPPSGPEPPGAVGTGHRTKLRHRPPRRRPPHPRRRPPPPTYRQ